MNRDTYNKLTKQEKSNLTHYELRQIKTVKEMIKIFNNRPYEIANHPELYETLRKLKDSQNRAIEVDAADVQFLIEKFEENIEKDLPAQEVPGDVLETGIFDGTKENLEFVVLIEGNHRHRAKQKLFDEEDKEGNQIYSGNDIKFYAETWKEETSYVTLELIRSNGNNHGQYNGKERTFADLLSSVKKVYKDIKKTTYDEIRADSATKAHYLPFKEYKKLSNSTNSDVRDKALNAVVKSIQILFDCPSKTATKCAKSIQEYNNPAVMNWNGANGDLYKAFAEDSYGTLEEYALADKWSKKKDQVKVLTEERNGIEVEIGRRYALHMVNVAHFSSLLGKIIRDRAVQLEAGKTFEIILFQAVYYEGKDLGKQPYFKAMKERRVLREEINRVSKSLGFRIVDSIYEAPVIKGKEYDFRKVKLKRGNPLLFQPAPHENKFKIETYKGWGTPS